jgi:predicted CoA-binding protein
MTDWRDRIIDDPVQARAIAGGARRVAVLGIKPESRKHEPAYYVPAYLIDAGIEVVPVPVYYPNVTEILGQPVVRSLRAVPRPVDIVDVFRRPEDVPDHLDDLIALKPGTVWMQAGIRHDAVAEALARAGIDVVQDRCLMVEHQRAQAWG